MNKKILFTGFFITSIFLNISLIWIIEGYKELVSNHNNQEIAILKQNKDYEFSLKDEVVTYKTLLSKKDLNTTQYNNVFKHRLDEVDKVLKKYAAK